MIRDDLIDGEPRLAGLRLLVRDGLINCGDARV